MIIGEPWRKKFRFKLLQFPSLKHIPQHLEYYRILSIIAWIFIYRFVDVITSSWKTDWNSQWKVLLVSTRQMENGQTPDNDCTIFSIARKWRTTNKCNITEYAHFLLEDSANKRSTNDIPIGYETPDLGRIGIGTDPPTEQQYVLGDRYAHSGEYDTLARARRPRAKRPRAFTSQRDDLEACNRPLLSRPTRHRNYHGLQAEVDKPLSLSNRTNSETQTRWTIERMKTTERERESGRANCFAQWR